MFEKVVDFLGNVVVNGIVAIFVALVTCFVLGFVCALAMIPVSIIGGDSSAKAIQSFVDNWPWFRIIYAIVFFEMMVESYGFIGIKAIFYQYRKGWKKWRGEKTTNLV